MLTILGIIGFVVLLGLLGLLRNKITKGENPFPDENGKYRIF